MKDKKLKCKGCNQELTGKYTSKKTKCFDCKIKYRKEWKLKQKACTEIHI